MILKRNMRRSQLMATDRQTPCLYYVCAGLCTKGRKADYAHYCQHCNKYRARADEATTYEKYRRKLKIFTCGFYIGMVLWMCGLFVSVTVENIKVKILLIFTPLVVYHFFVIGKGIIEDKLKRGNY